MIEANCLYTALRYLETLHFVYRMFDMGSARPDMMHDEAVPSFILLLSFVDSWSYPIT